MTDIRNNTSRANLLLLLMLQVWRKGFDFHTRYDDGGVYAIQAYDQSNHYDCNKILSVCAVHLTTTGFREPLGTEETETGLGIRSP